MSSTHRLLESPLPSERPTRKTNLPARPRRTRGIEDDVRSSSVLDEGRRRVKRNVGQIGSLLRLEDRDASASSTEAVLADMTRQLQTMASDQRNACRSGQFDGVDLAVYLKHAASFLSRSTGRGTNPGGSSRGGWVLADSGHTLSWIRSIGNIAQGHEDFGRDLSDAISFLSREAKETIGRATSACAIVFPPGVFAWRTSPPPRSTDGPDHTVSPGDLWIRMQPAADHWRIEVSVDDRGLGLPRSPDQKTRRKMEQDLASVLAALFENCSGGSGAHVVFSVALVSAEAGHAVAGAPTFAAH